MKPDEALKTLRQFVSDVHTASALGALVSEQVLQGAAEAVELLYEHDAATEPRCICGDAGASHDLFNRCSRRDGKWETASRKRPRPPDPPPGATEEDPGERNERYFIQGQRSVWQGLISRAKTELGVTGRTLESLIAEREAAVAALRSLCEDFGDNDWESDLHLADVIEKHLARHLEQA